MAEAGVRGEEYVIEQVSYRLKMKSSEKGQLTLRQLQAWLDDLRDITFDCKVSALNLRFLQTNDFKDKGSQLFLASGFALHLEQQYLFTLTTQLDKLYSSSPNQGRSFKHLFHRLLAHPMHDSINTARLVPSKGWSDTRHLHAAIRYHQKRLEPVQNAIKKVTIVRNAITAHTAIKRPRTGPSLDELDQLADLASGIVNGLERRVGDRTTLFGYLKDFEVKFMVHYVAEAYRLRQSVNG